MRILLPIAFALLVGVIAFLSGIRWGPQLTAGEALFHESTALCSAPEGKPFRIGSHPARERLQIHSRAGAPAGAVERDRFTELRSVAEWMVLLRIAEASAGEIGPGLARPGPASAFLGGIRCEEVASPIGTPDVEIVITGTVEGYQIAVTADGETRRSTHRWQE